MTRWIAMARLAFVALLVASPSSVLAEESSRQELLTRQRLAKSKQLEPYSISKGERRVLGLEQATWPQTLFVKGYRGFRPIIGGAPQGAGWLVGGVGYSNGHSRENLFFDVAARASSNRFFLIDMRIDMLTSLSPLPFRASLIGSFQDLTRVHFYGLGNESDDVESHYRTKNSWAGAEFAYRPLPLIELNLDGRWMGVRSMPSKKCPRLEDLFDPTTVPGFNEPRTEYAVFGGSVTLGLRDRQIPSAGVTLHVEARRYDDQDLDRHDFTRLIGEFVTHIPLGYRNRMLAGRIRTSHSMPDTGHDVPFNLMEAFGGSRTLRGFDSDRFRDRRNLLVGLEYRWEVWTYLDFALFYDSGKVFSDADALSLTDMKRGYGFGTRIHTPVGTVIRLDLARSYEGFQVYLWTGQSIFH